jgi:hypothetical protein
MLTTKERNELAKDEILRVLLNSKLEVRFKDLRDKTWAIISSLPAITKGKDGLKESSFRSKYLNQFLVELANEGYVGQHIVTTKNVAYFIRKESEEKVKSRISNSLNNLQEPFIKFLAFETKVSKQPTLFLFTQELQVLIAPYSLKVYEASTKQNRSEFDWYKKAGQRVLSSLYDIACDYVYTSENRRKEAQNFQKELNLLWRTDPPDPQLAEAWLQMLPEPWNIIKWLEVKLREENRFYSRSTQDQQRVAEERLIRDTIENSRRNIKKQLRLGEKNPVEFELELLRNARNESALQVRVMDATIKQIELEAKGQT